MWLALSTRQRTFLIGLAVANLVLFTAMGALLSTPEPGPIASPAPRPLETNVDPACRAAAADALAERAVAGTIAIHTDGSIDFALSGDDPTDAWDAFAVSSELPTHGCGPYDPVRIDLPDPSQTPHLRLIVEAQWADVKAWSLGRLDDEALSDRTARSTYLSHPLAPAP